ncbi:hypothetical protein BaRGS_00011990 [Batillaria attramentaria]|uniref:Uncharacterized protein n=1 Tax=Batillaria attramentaria TaxID=370345 RepID=A0ABD0LB44_9CAEN
MWALPLTLAACLLAGGRAYFFESGYTHHYTYKAENDLLGQGNITTILKFQVSAVNETENGHRLHSLTVDSLVQFMKGGPVMNNPHGWDLTKTFLFVVDDTGGVRLVHCHPEDHEELLVIKKAMVSVFSVHVKIKYDEKEWVYKAEETDHLGRLEHSYRAQRTATGLKLERNFSSFDDAHRFHEKTLHYDHHGTLHKAETKDRVHLKDRLPPPEKT